MLFAGAGVDFLTVEPLLDPDDLFTEGLLLEPELFGVLELVLRLGVLTTLGLELELPLDDAFGFCVGVVVDRAGGELFCFGGVEVCFFTGVEVPLFVLPVLRLGSALLPVLLLELPVLLLVLPVLLVVLPVLLVVLPVLLLVLPVFLVVLPVLLVSFPLLFVVLPLLLLVVPVLLLVLPVFFVVLPEFLRSSSLPRSSVFGASFFTGVPLPLLLVLGCCVEFDGVVTRGGLTLALVLLALWSARLKFLLGFTECPFFVASGLLPISRLLSTCEASAVISPESASITAPAGSVLPARTRVLAWLPALV